MARHAPQCTVVTITGGGSCWVHLPAGVGAVELAAPPPRACFRLGLQSIPARSIEPGIALLGGAIAALQAGC